MKNVFLLLMAFISLNFINSCREDGDWEKANESFSYTVERDKNYIEKGVGEANQLTFNINPNYNFSKIETSFKFVTSLNGVLKLNGQVLTANQEYTFENEKNVFEYTGNVSGTHDLTISTKNSKGYSVEEKFALPYGVSEFTHTFNGGTAPIYQGDETQYLMKVVAGAGQPNTGYQIKFNSYSGTIKFNGVPANVDTWYPINNIDSFTTSLTTNTGGQGKLTYSIKNSTVSKDYEIQQTILPRTIVIESLNISALNVLPNTQMSLIGVIKKSPVTTNTTIQYKTWISSASNNNVAGIQTTNNAYTPYALGSNGNLQLSFNALEVGNYTLNFQAKDEFGNESEVKSFNIVVEKSVQFVGALTGKVNFGYKIIGFSIKGYLLNFDRTFRAQTGGTNSINKVIYTVKFTHINQNFTYNFDETFTSAPKFVEFQAQNFDFADILYKDGNSLNANQFLTALTNVSMTVKVQTADGSTVEETFTPSITNTKM